MPSIPTIPEYITVHLGPPDSNARNVTVPFPDYIKNVASSEIYPTWPENALRANIEAIVTFALNRIYTAWYPSRGYNFDITNSTQYDQAFVYGRDIYENISSIVDELFNDYIRRQGDLEPLFAQFCNGTTVTCDGLSQWGTVDLARQGYTPLQILRTYYGSDIEIVENAPIRNGPPAQIYPGYPLTRGLQAPPVRQLQLMLNRVSRNYPAIPRITPVDGVFGENTEEAVKAFQRIFNLTPDGVVGKATWNRLYYLYVSVKRLAELNSEGIAQSSLDQQFPDVLREGERGSGVRVLQYRLALIGRYISQLPPVQIDGIFGPGTKNAVIAFQRYAGLSPDGVVGQTTWDVIARYYLGILESLPDNYFGGEAPRSYPGSPLSYGDRGSDVAALQNYLTVISRQFPAIPAVASTGYFGDETRNAVRIFQSENNLTPDGIVGPRTWDAIAGTYGDILSGYSRF
ncbi:MAG: peptidoglycan-binding protein [Oscillospiraceae bacterium]|nr:peptidoglycan-binding protein [Oscillospiraceae bacterium]